MMMEAETGVMCPQAKERQRLPEATRSKESTQERFFPRTFRGGTAMWTP